MIAHLYQKNTLTTWKTSRDICLICLVQVMNNSTLLWRVYEILQFAIFSEHLIDITFLNYRNGNSLNYSVYECRKATLIQPSNTTEILNQAKKQKRFSYSLNIEYARKDLTRLHYVRDEIMVIPWCFLLFLYPFM